MKRRAGLKPALAAVKRCAIYTRKSTSAGLEQEFSSLDAQYEACKAYIDRQPGWQLIDKRYDDGGFTGANTDRPAFQQLLSDIDNHLVDVVVVYKVDRLSRSLLDFAQIMERFSAAGASFVSVTQNFSTADAIGRLTLNMLMSFAEFEREMISERTRDKIAASRRKGKWTGGPVPLGYQVVDKRLVVHELEAVVVREVFETYLEQRSILAVMRLLNERHRATKRHRSANGRLRESRPWSKSDILRVLKNPVYAGFMSSDGDLYEAEHTPIISKLVFNAVRAQLAKSAQKETRSHGRNPDYLLRGLLRCACCEGTFTPASTRKGRREYRYYRCFTRDKYGPEACLARPLPAAAIEDFAVEKLREAVASQNLSVEVAERVKARVMARRKDLLIERQKLPTEIATLSNEGKRLVETISNLSEHARRLLDEKLEEVGTQLARCETRLREAEAELANLDLIEVDSVWLANCLANFSKVWDILTAENRSRLVRAVVERVEVDEPSGRIRVFIVDLAAPISPPPSTALIQELAP